MAFVLNHSFPVPGLLDQVKFAGELLAGHVCAFAILDDSANKPNNMALRVIPRTEADNEFAQSVKPSPKRLSLIDSPRRT